MKTFKQLMEELPYKVSHRPKQFDVFKSDLRFIRTPDIIKKENRKFRSVKYPVPFNLTLPQAKKKSDKNIKTA